MTTIHLDGGHNPYPDDGGVWGLLVSTLDGVFDRVDPIFPDGVRDDGLYDRRVGQIAWAIGDGETFKIYHRRIQGGTYHNAHFIHLYHETSTEVIGLGYAFYSNPEAGPEEVEMDLTITPTAIYSSNVVGSRAAEFRLTGVADRGKVIIVVSPNDIVRTVSLTPI